MKKIIFSIIVLILAFNTLALADESWSFDISGVGSPITGNLGESEKGKFITALVLNPGYEYSDIENAIDPLDSIVYYGVTYVANDGSFEFNFDLPDKTGTYTIYVGGNATVFSSGPQKKTVRYLKQDDLKKIVASLKEKNSFEETLSFLEEKDSEQITNAMNLNLDLSQLPIDTNAKNNVIKRLFNARNLFDENNISLTLSLIQLKYAKGILIEEINKTSSFDELKTIVTNPNNTSDFSTVISMDILKNLSTLNGQLLFSNFSKNKPFDETKEMVDIANCINISIFLIDLNSIVTNNTNLAKLINEYSSILNVDISSGSSFNKLSAENKDSLYRQLLISRNYLDISAFESKFNSLVSELLTIQNNPPKDSSASLGGGSSGSGGGSVGVIFAPQTAVPTAPTNIDDVFTDLGEISWAKEAIKNLYDKDIISAPLNKKFNPNDYVTREELVKMIVIAFQLSDKNKEISFLDVDANGWYYDYIKIAFSNRIINGISDYDFGIGNNITREDFFTIAKRALDMKDTNLSINESGITFSDDNLISDYAKNAIYYLKKSGVVSGYNDGTIQPKSFATRAEAAKILSAIIK